MEVLINLFAITAVYIGSTDEIVVGNSARLGDSNDSEVTSD